MNKCSFINTDISRSDNCSHNGSFMLYQYVRPEGKNENYNYNVNNMSRILKVGLLIYKI